MLHCSPFLLFDGNCAEAMTFYQKCLGGELVLTRTGDTPMKDQFPLEKHDLIIYAQLKSGAMELSATDWHSDTLIRKHGNSFSIYLTGGSYNEIKSIFEKFAEGASRESFIEINDMPFGSYGQLTDKFGVPWIFTGEKKQSSKPSTTTKT